MKRILLVAALALGACTAPSSYDGLTGGTKEDAAVAAPRPVSPISVSLIASRRPHLRWDLGAALDGKLTGAVVEMSRTRDFAKDVKRFDAKGGDLVVPEDLELGVWFWRLKGNASGSVGTATSVVWEMVVRGPAAHGSSDAPSRALVDLDGDGQPELLIAGTGDFSNYGATTPVTPEGPSAQTPSTPPAAKGTTGPAVFVYGTGKDPARGLSMLDSIWFDTSPYDGPIGIGSGTDFDGDGATDVILAGMTAGYYQGTLSFAVDVMYGAPEGKTPFDGNRLVPPPYLPATSSVPSVREGADIDGDGYGDAVVGLQGVSMLMLGNAASKGPYEGQSATVALAPDPFFMEGPSRVAIGGFDANGDGLSDLVFAAADQNPTTVRTLTVPGSRGQRIGDHSPLDGSEARPPTAFAAGDYNGDGIDDVAITTAAKICIWYGDRDKLLVRGPCVAPDANDTDFGLGLTAADLEGDGVDELLATTKSAGVDGIRVLRIGDGEVITKTPIGTPGLGVRLTTIWPGRPGKARWAAASGDGSRIAVFEGADLQTALLPPSGIVKGWGRGLR